MLDNASLDNPKTQDEVDRAIGEVAEKFAPDPVEAVEDRSERKLDDGLGMLDLPVDSAFPPDPDPIAYGGVLGQCVYDLAEGTDASLVGLLGSLLAFAGALIPGKAYFHRWQTSSPYIVLVGESSIGRKGTAMMRASDAMKLASGNEVSVNRIVLDGLNSGEGLVASLAYKRETYPSHPTVGLVFEEEFASLLASRGREGSTLDQKMRTAFDGGPISNRRSGETKSVLPPYWLGALVAITPTELREKFNAGAMNSGSANRWLYLPVVRRDVMPDNREPEFQDGRLEHVHAAIMAADNSAAQVGVDQDVITALVAYGDWLPDVSWGIARDLTRRLPVIAFRIALIHALVDRDLRVTLKHLNRALALTEYARHGIPWVFREIVGDKDADLLLRHLRASGRLTKTMITREILRDPGRQQAAIDVLRGLGLADIETSHQVRGGRPRAELVISTKGGLFPNFQYATPSEA